MNDELIESGLPMVYRIAHDLKAELAKSCELEELIADGMHGLVVAAANFKPELGYQFSTYARWRIHGQIIDGLRARDVVSRRKNWDPADVRLQPALRLDQPLDGAEPLGVVIPDPADAFEAAEDIELVHQLMRRLTGEQLAVVRAFLWEDEDLSTQARRRGLTPSRMSQIYQDALHTMRLGMLASGLETTVMLGQVQHRARMKARQGKRLLSGERRALFADLARAG